MSSGRPDTTPPRTAAAPERTELAELAGFAEFADRFAAVAMANVTRPYPYAPAHLLRGPEDLVPPRDHHPAFYGSYDWH
ncbi:DUF2891 family protein, partial [Streptomyces sp. 2MCAF27]